MPLGHTLCYAVYVPRVSGLPPARLRAHVGPVGLDEHHCVSARALCVPFRSASIAQVSFEALNKSLRRKSGGRLLASEAASKVVTRSPPSPLLVFLIGHMQALVRRTLEEIGVHCVSWSMGRFEVMLISGPDPCLS